MRLLILSSAYRTDISLGRGHYLYFYGSQMPIQICWNFLPLLAQWLYLFKSNKKEISTILEVIFFWHPKGCLNTLKSIFMAIFIGERKLRCRRESFTAPDQHTRQTLASSLLLSYQCLHSGTRLCAVSSQEVQCNLAKPFTAVQQTLVSWVLAQTLAPLTVRERGLLPFCGWDAC